jgi:hypothetical protein
MDPNAPAFPVDAGRQGLTVRQYFAIVAMQGVLARSKCPPDVAADEAVKMADALIAELALPHP